MKGTSDKNEAPGWREMRRTYDFLLNASAVGVLESSIHEGKQEE